MVEAYDFTSSYGYCLLAFKYPMEKFTKIKSNLKISDILNTMDDYAYIFKLECIGVELKDLHEPMPYFQFSKCRKINNEILDNGRILQCEYAEIYITEQDLYILNKQYNFRLYKISDCYCAKKSYLPRWLTDYVYDLFRDKTNEKDGDPILYAILKSKLNSIYGMLVMKWIKEVISEDYKTGEYTKNIDADKIELFNKFVDTKNNIFPYQWGVYCTAYAVKNLFELGSFCEVWLYSDTDSCYGIGWDENEIKKYNEKCINNLKNRGYLPIKKDGNIYALGVAELDGVYSEFKTLGAKRYVCRYAEDARNKKKNWNKLKITVAGVPKKGVASLNNDINNFKKGTVFSGKISGKLQHTYLYVDNIYIDKDGNEVGDSIDLTECDYLLDTIEKNLLASFDSDLEFINNNMIGVYEDE